MKSLKAILSLAVLGTAVYVGWMVAPAYIQNYQLQDEMKGAARLNAASNRSEQEIRDSLYKAAREIGVPITADQINIVRAGNDLVIWADYTVHIDLPYRPFDLEFHPSSRSDKAER